MSSLMFGCPQNSISTIFEKRLTHGPTDQRTDGRTDKASYRDAWTHLKTTCSKKIPVLHLNVVIQAFIVEISMSNMDIDMFARRTNWLMKRLGEIEGGCCRFSIAGYAVAVVKSMTMPFFWMRHG